MAGASQVKSGWDDVSFSRRATVASPSDASSRYVGVDGRQSFQPAAY